MRALLFFFSIVCTCSHVLAAKTFDAKRWQTSNGAQVVFFQAMEVPMLNISMAFAAGSAYDGELYGLSSLTTRLLDEGNSGMGASVIADKLADTGAQYEGESTRDMAVLNLKTLTAPEALNSAIEIFTSIVSHPDFPTESFKREQSQQLIGIAQEEESPDEVANKMFFKALYQKHPYAHPISGTKESVSAITIEQVRQFYHQFFVSNNAIIVLVGAIDQPTAKKLAEQITHDMPRGEHAGEIPKAYPLTEELNIGIKFPSSQTVLRIGQLGIDHHNKNYFPYTVGNYSLGGGALVSRLATEVREKRGLTYGVYSEFSPMPGLGPFLIRLSTKNNQAATALDVTRSTLGSFITKGPKDQELIAAKQYLTGSFPLSLASNNNIANMLMRMAFYHLPDNFLDTYRDNINQVTAPQIKQAFQELIVPNKMLEISVGKM